MFTLTIVIIAIVIYMLSAYYSYNWHRKAYSRGGRWSLLNPQGIEIFFTFMPVVNTIFAFTCLMTSPYENSNGCGKFFNVKK